MKFIKSFLLKTIMISGILTVLYCKKETSNIFPKDTVESIEHKENILNYLHEFSNPNNISDKTIFMFLMCLCLISILIKVANTEKTIKDNIDYKGGEDISLKGRAKLNANNIDYSLLENKRDTKESKKLKVNMDLKKDMYSYVDSLYETKKEEKKPTLDTQQMTQEKLFDYIFNK